MAKVASDKARSQKKDNVSLIPRPSWRSFTYFLVSLAVISFIFGLATYSAGTNLDTENRKDIAERLVPYSAALHTELSNRLDVVASISAFAKAHENDEDLEPEFVQFAEKIFNEDLGIRNFQIVLGTVTKYVYPLEGNSQMIGMDWMKVSGSNLKYMEEAITSKHPTMIGPFEAHRGTWVIAAVDPLYKPDGSSYGLGAAVYDYYTVVKDSGLDRSKSTMDLAVRNKDKTTVYGKTAVFKSNPVIRNIKVVGSYWQVAAIPKGGWAASRNSRLLPMVLASVVIVLLIAGLIAVLADRQRHMREMVYERTKELNASNKELEKSYQTIRRSLDGTVEAIAAITEYRDPYTAGHERRVVNLSVAIGKELNLDDSALEGLRTAATLHDVGKTFIPAEILHKPGRLSDLEFSMIKSHPVYSYEMLRNIDFPWPIADIALQHHERIDGSGYPKGLKGKDIMIEAKIIAVADVIEAMASNRPYRPALPLQEALDEIKKGKGKLYDDRVAETALRLFKEGFEF